MEHKVVIRNNELDTVKFFAILVIYTSHFVDTFCPDKAYLWHTMPTSIILSGITGKLGVAIFGVLLGYFAYIANKRLTLLEYSINRYGYFVFVGLFINIIYCTYFKMPFSNIMEVSLTVSNDIFPTYWCMRDFLFASIFCYYIGISNFKFNDRVIVILILFAIGQVWIPICMLGVLIPELKEHALLKNRMMSCIFFLVSFWIIKRPENSLTYILDGLFAVIMLCIIENNLYLRKVLSNNVTASLGRRTMAIFVIHPITYSIVGEYLFAHYNLSVKVIWLLCFVIICILSYPVTYIFGFYSKCVTLLYKNLRKLMAMITSE